METKPFTCAQLLVCMASASEDNDVYVGACRQRGVAAMSMFDRYHVIKNIRDKAFAMAPAAAAEAPAVEAPKLVRSSKAASRTECPVCQASVFSSEFFEHVQSCADSAFRPPAKPSSPAAAAAQPTTTTSPPPPVQAAKKQRVVRVAPLSPPPPAPMPLVLQSERTRVIKVRLPAAPIVPVLRLDSKALPPPLPAAPPRPSPPADSFAGTALAEPDKYKSFFAKAAAMAAAQAAEGAASAPRDVELVDLGDGFTMIASKEPFRDGMGEGETRALRCEIVHLIDVAELAAEDSAAVREENASLRERVTACESLAQAALARLHAATEAEIKLKAELASAVRTGAEHQSEREACEEENAALRMEMDAAVARVVARMEGEKAMVEGQRAALAQQVAQLQRDVEALKAVAPEEEEEYAELMRAWVHKHAGSVPCAALAVFHGGASFRTGDAQNANARRRWTVKPRARALWARLCPQQEDADAVRAALCDKFRAKLGLCYVAGPPPAVELGKTAVEPVAVEGDAVVDADVVQRACAMVRGNGGSLAWKRLAAQLPMPLSARQGFVDAVRDRHDAALFCVDGAGEDKLVVAASHAESVLVALVCDYLLQTGGVMDAAGGLAGLSASCPGAAQLRSLLGDAAKLSTLAASNPERLVYWPATADGVLAAQLSLCSEQTRVAEQREHALAHARAKDAWVRRVAGAPSSAPATPPVASSASASAPAAAEGAKHPAYAPSQPQPPPQQPQQPQPPPRAPMLPRPQFVDQWGRQVPMPPPPHQAYFYPPQAHAQAHAQAPRPPPFLYASRFHPQLQPQPPPPPPMPQPPPLPQQQQHRQRPDYGVNL